MKTDLFAFHRNTLMGHFIAEAVRDGLKVDFVSRVLDLHPEHKNNAGLIDIAFGDAVREVAKCEADANAITAIDPSTGGDIRLAILTPAFNAIMNHRIAHALHDCNLMLAAAAVRSHTMTLSGIDIHPGASIGTRFAIDHGNGIVIGATAIIDDGVTLYQGVTLGTSKRPATAGFKRHPTLKNGVTVYAGAMVLGDIVIGAGCEIGAGAIVSVDLPKRTKVPIGAIITRESVDFLAEQYERVDGETGSTRQPSRNGGKGNAC